MDIQWEYNNIRIKKGDEWKAVFITPYGLYEPLVMFLGQCNSPLTFQAFMYLACGDMIVERWLVIYMDNFLVMADTEALYQERMQWVLQ